MIAFGSELDERQEGDRDKILLLRGELRLISDGLPQLAEVEASIAKSLKNLGRSGEMSKVIDSARRLSPYVSSLRPRAVTRSRMTGLLN